MSVQLTALHHPAAVREALARRGVPPARAHAAAGGLQPIGLLFDQLDPVARDAVARSAGACGVECLTGDGWALLAGTAGRLAVLGRPQAGLPPELAPVVGRSLSALLDPPTTWELAHGSLALEHPVVVGILNLTPDSFSDGGRYTGFDAAARHAESMIEAGAGMLDLGAESTRPGRLGPVDAEEEWRRLRPVLTAVVNRFPGVPVSVDTVKAMTAGRALDAGAWAINDVSGLRHDPGVADLCAEHRAGLVLMHSRGGVNDMATYDHAQYADVGAELVQELSAAVSLAECRGVRRSAMVVDPGLGFAKRPEHNYQALQQLPALAGLGLPIMVGPSRKRFLESVTGRAVGDRDPATAGACVAAYSLGARLFRVHAVAPARDALAVAHAVGGGGG